MQTKKTINGTLLKTVNRGEVIKYLDQNSHTDKNTFALLSTGKGFAFVSTDNLTPQQMKEINTIITGGAFSSEKIKELTGLINNI